MYKKNIYLVEFNQLFLILNEINNFLNYNLIEINDNDFLKKNFNEKNSLFLFKNSKLLEKKNQNFQNNLVLDDIPIEINKLVEKINIFFFKKYLSIKL